MKVTKRNAEHYIWGDNCDGWFMANEPDRTIIHERMPAGTAEARHYHETAKQFFFLLSGTAVMEADGEQITLLAHEGISIPPRMPHQIKNESNEDVEFLVISQPSTRGDRVQV
ncbi:cupin domain-containing protein [Paenibacillus harenae]|uniref:cupin domain-containing protein n=1 Tax=Paenibacillus harenae TaxID=306543 RepID=UPI0004105E19|nr:cupin domain-containing protein [Paenibacillus harenae]